VDHFLSPYFPSREERKMADQKKPFFAHSKYADKYQQKSISN
jgi:hypothetical protein